MQLETSLQLQEHGRRSQQRGPDARRPGAAAEASRATAVASPGSGAGAGAADATSTPASSAPRLRDVHKTRDAEEHDDEREQWQDPSHLLLKIPKLVLPSRMAACLGEEMNNGFSSSLNCRGQLRLRVHLGVRSIYARSGVLPC